MLKVCVVISSDSIPFTRSSQFCSKTRFFAVSSYFLLPRSIVFHSVDWSSFVEAILVRVVAAHAPKTSHHVPCARQELNVRNSFQMTHHQQAPVIESQSLQYESSLCILCGNLSIISPMQLLLTHKHISFLISLPFL